MKRLEYRREEVSSGGVGALPQPSTRSALGRPGAGRIGPAAIEALQGIRKRTNASKSDADRDDLFTRAIDLMPDPSMRTRLLTPVKCIATVGEEVRMRFGDASRGAFAVAFVAHLAIELLPRLDRMGLTPAILNEYPAAFDRLIVQLEDSADDYWIGNEFFLKDVRIAGGYSAPCHIADIDLKSTINLRSGFKAFLTQFDFKGGLRLMRIGGTQWYRTHTDTRHLANFDEAGQRRGDLMLADLLRLHPEVGGVTRTSWYFDPRVAHISPHLAHLQALPVANGAFLVRHGSHPIQRARANAKSRTRRALVASGQYVPQAYSVVWPREELLRWAEVVEINELGSGRRIPPTR